MATEARYVWALIAGVLAFLLAKFAWHHGVFFALLIGIVVAVIVLLLWSVLGSGARAEAPPAAADTRSTERELAVASPVATTPMTVAEPEPVVPAAPVAPVAPVATEAASIPDPVMAAPAPLMAVEAPPAAPVAKPKAAKAPARTAAKAPAPAAKAAPATKIKAAKTPATPAARAAKPAAAVKPAEVKAAAPKAKAAPKAEAAVKAKAVTEAKAPAKAAPAAAPKAPAKAPTEAPAKAKAPAKAAPAKAKAPARPKAPPKPQAYGLAAPRGGKADDLKEIEGIGPALEKLLNGMGVWSFDQIAGWTAADIAHVDGQMERFRGRIARDRWVSQAGIIVKDGLDAFRERARTNDY